MKKIIGGVTAATLIVTLAASPALAEDNGGYGKVPSNASKILSKKDGYYRVSLDEKGQGAAHSSMFVQVSNRYEFGDWEMCTDIDQGFCRGSDSKRVGGSSILPICTTKIENCVSSVRIYKEGEEPRTAVFKGNIPGYQTKAKPSIGLPEGSTIALFDSPTTPHTSGSEYAVSASIAWDKPPGGKFNPYSFDIRVAATKPISIPGAKPARPDNCVAPDSEQETGRKGVCSVAIGGGCFYDFTDGCGYDQKFSPNTRIGVTLILSNRFTGWLRGRIKDPILSVTKINSNFNEVAIDASPVDVPRLFTQYNIKDVPRGAISDQGVTWGGTFDTLTYSYEADSVSGVNVIKHLRKPARDTASGVTSLWTVSSFDSSFKRCLSSDSRLQGLVTTNAMAYLGTEPTWRSGRLDYKVAGMHYLPDGKTIATGTYDLVMRSSTARCLYGFSKAPIYAVISVRGESGEKKVATTVVSEKGGWLKLAAYDFTFSNPTIQVRLTQKKSR
jgi:hypothetical protein